MIRSPCMGCEFRRVGCHGECEPYKDFLAQKGKEREARIGDVNARSVAAERARKKKDGKGWSMKRDEK